MADPLSSLGGQVTDWDSSSIEFTGPSGGIVRMARQFAPPQLQQQVAQAEAAGVASPRSQVMAAGGAPTPGNAFGVEVGPGGTIPGGLANNLSQPPAAARPPPGAAPTQGPQAPPEPQGLTDPLAPVQQRIAELRAQPQVVQTAGGTRTAQSRTALDPEAVERAGELQTDVGTALGAAEAARGEQAEVMSEAESQLANLAGSQAAELARAQTEQATDDQRYRERQVLEQEKLAKLNEAARTEIDPRKWWKDQSTGKKIMAGIGAFLGAYGAALTRGPNTFMEQFNGAIQRDVDAQLENRRGKREEAGDQLGFMRVLKGEYEDAAQRRQAGLIMGQNLVAAQVEQIGHQSASATVQAKAKELSAQLRADAARQTQEFVLKTAGNVTTQTQQVGGGVRPSAAAQEAAALEKGTWVDFDPTAMIPAAERYTGLPMQAIGGKDDAKDINKQMAAVEQFDVKLQKLEQLGKKGLSSPTDRNLATSLYASAMLDAKNIDDAGALDIGAVQIMREVFGAKPTDLLKVGGSTLPSVRASLRTKVASTLSNRAAAVNPNSVPLTMRARFAPGGRGGAAPAAPRTQPLDEELQ